MKLKIEKNNLKYVTDNSRSLVYFSKIPCAPKIVEVAWQVDSQIPKIYWQNSQAVEALLITTTSAYSLNNIVVQRNKVSMRPGAA